MEFHEFVELIESDKREEPKECKGLIFRCETTMWRGSDGSVNFKERYCQLARKSCPGCQQCDWLMEDLDQRLYDFLFADTISRGGSNGALYKLEVTNMSTDWETGFVDDYDVGFAPYKEPENVEKKEE